MSGFFIFRKINNFVSDLIFLTNFNSSFMAYWRSGSLQIGQLLKFAYKNRKFMAAQYGRSGRSSYLKTAGAIYHQRNFSKLKLITVLISWFVAFFWRNWINVGFSDLYFIIKIKLFEILCLIEKIIVCPLETWQLHISQVTFITNEAIAKKIELEFLE